MILNSLRTYAPASSRLSCLIFCGGLLYAQSPALGQTPLTERERALLDRIESLEKRVAALEGKTPSAAPAESPRSSVLGGAASGAAAAAAVPSTQPDTAAKQGVFGLSGSTLNLYFDGYYGWNFNRPVGRANLLLANDVLSHNFTLNQFGLI